MDPIKFGTDGWRGVIARDFTFENVRRVAQAIADYVKEDQAKNVRKKTPLSGPMVVGFDKRFQSDAFAREIAKVLEANHLNPTLMAESLPTPAVSYLSRKLGGVGVMVTASHNPPADNGYKLYAGDGAQIIPPDDEIVERHSRDAAAPTLGERTSALHRYVTEDELDRYRDHVVDRFAVAGGSDSPSTACIICVRPLCTPPK